MPFESEIADWRALIRSRYESYLKTSFYFKSPALRKSFARALSNYDLMKDEYYPELAHQYEQGASAQAMAENFFGKNAADIFPALMNQNLYSHQEKALQKVFHERKNVVVATGTASGKTESFLYPILFELYRQHLSGELETPGVRALVLYPMNALANDQRDRLGDICKKLREADSRFSPTFGQYIGETPEDRNDCRRHGSERDNERCYGERVFRQEMRESPPHILLTNYSMLEYLLIRPQDSTLFDNGRGKNWQFIVLDEAHQYRGVKGMEMGMLIRRLKQRLRDGGRESGGFRCIATSATIASTEDAKNRHAVASFAKELFAEKFTDDDVVFGKRQEQGGAPRRFHLFMRALEGAFLVHHQGKDEVVLNRQAKGESKPLEIALCSECGEHYYVGRTSSGFLEEAVRDPSHPDFGVEFYLPVDSEETNWLCRQCGKIAPAKNQCGCGADIGVKKCETGINEHQDQLKKCESCGYQRGSIGDPVREIVHGSEAPNTVIATALHELLNRGERSRKVLAFADSRQEAAFFAWYAESSYNKIRNRNLIYRALASADCTDGLAVDSLKNRMLNLPAWSGLFSKSDDAEKRDRKTLAQIYREIISDEKRISLKGVGLAEWFVSIPENFDPPKEMFDAPWNFNGEEAKDMVVILLNNLCSSRAVFIAGGVVAPNWADVCDYPPKKVHRETPDGRGNGKVLGWCNPDRSITKHFLFRILDDGMSKDKKKDAAKNLMLAVWDAIREHDKGRGNDDDAILHRIQGGDGTFQINSKWLRIKPHKQGGIFECDTCAQLHFRNVRNICERNFCPGYLRKRNINELPDNHYRNLYKEIKLPASFCSKEHTAQLQSEKAREYQREFKNDAINLLSSSTTFEVGVDLGDLDVVFMRNVPPEPFNYTQRAGRAGRGDTPGLALTYCRRNPHDLYHYIKPQETILSGKIQPPTLHMRNKKIIQRHITAMALSAFFKKNSHRFENVEKLIGEIWKNSRGRADFREFCLSHNSSLNQSLADVVPEEMHKEIGLLDQSWVDKIAGEESRFADAENDVCGEYLCLREMESEFSQRGEYPKANRAQRRANTIAKESALVFLSRKAIIPKYGFPVDVVELDTRPEDGGTAVSLQRDLSQAIAEYAPGSKVVANKKEWESKGIKKVGEKEFEIRRYLCDDARNFRKIADNDPPEVGEKKYLWPQFGFVTSRFDKPKEPKGKARRLYATRPYFGGFHAEPLTQMIHDVKMTQTSPGSMVVLCGGKNGEGFHICKRCGAGFSKIEHPHKNPDGQDCKGGFYEPMSLGHEFVTDVMRLQFPKVTEEWPAYSLAFALLLGAAQILNVPENDINATITGGVDNHLAIVLYDNVPGGAGLVANLWQGEIFTAALQTAEKRMSGKCGCDESCYGCLRNYRNQFAHPYLRREDALQYLQAALKGG